MDRIVAGWRYVTIRERDEKYYAVYVFDKRMTYWESNSNIAVSEYEAICSRIKEHPEIENKIRELSDEIDARAKAFLGR